SFSASGSGAAAGRATPEMKRSAVRSLIQRYFHQLQSGCGNAHCTNDNCASSGKVAPMTPNEVAAKALQLFSQDAQLCEASASASSSPQDVDMLSPNDSSSSSSGSSTSTITSASTTTTTSTQSQSAPAAVVVAAAAAAAAPSESSIPVQSLPQLDLVAEPLSVGSGPCTPTLPPVQSLDANSLIALYEQCRAADSYDRICHAIGDVFSFVDRLSKSFVRSAEPAASSSLQELLDNPPEALNKEQLRMLEGEHDKDEDCTQKEEEEAAGGDSEAACSGEVVVVRETEAETEDEDVPMAQPEADSQAEGEDKSQSSDTMVDFQGLRRVQRLLFGCQTRAITEKLTTSVIQLAEWVQYMRPDWEKVIHCLVICFDLATNSEFYKLNTLILNNLHLITANNSVVDIDYLDRALPKLCQAAASMPVPAQARLARIWAAHCPDQLQTLVAACQQQITLQVLLDEESMRENGSIIGMTKVLKIVFYANILASELELPSCRIPLEDRAETPATSSSSSGPVEDDLFVYSSVHQPHMPKFAEDQLEKALQVSAIDCRRPLVPLEEFYNEALSENIQMHHDYLSYKTLAMESEMGSGQTNYFSFMLYAFILTPATKVDALYYDSRMRMYSERYSSLYSMLNNFGQDGQDGTPRPDLKLTVRRDQLINDALIGLELVAMSNPKDLKKQLVVEFVGEQGIDEGGVSKEFFQLIVEEIFNPAFGMFVQQEETNNMWFNATPFENGAQFTLIGIIIGLAIYNNVILAVNFPMVVYRKLMGYCGTFADLNDWSPTLYKSLKSMLDYQGEDMEEVFDQTFKISYSNVFGEMVEHELVPHGKDVLVGQHNKQLFVNLYSDFLLNMNIQQQFNAFRKGFEMVTDESPLKLLFRPEEIEMLVCGSREFDFVELEHSTEYEGGYTDETQIIQDFWSIVHAMPNESKRKLLEFTTGSARVPVGGLKCLRLLITRHGPDSDRLPTSHTCFNVLLLPEYSSREKLEERLLKAINYSKGFGML
ncbi:hypothetical protein KR059_005935, partial [Drosophila kikkawai]